MELRRGDKKKILFVISTLNTGGAQRAFANLSIGLSEKYECHFLLNDAENISYPYNGKVLNLGLKPEKDKTKLWYQFKVLWKRFLILRKLKKSGEYLCCISGLTSANAVNVLTRCKGCKTIISIRIFTSKDKLSGVKDFVSTAAIKALYNRADVITTVSEGAKLDLIRNYGIKKEKIVTIYNGYDIDKIQQSAKEELSDEEKEWFTGCGRMIVTMGRLTYQKGQQHLIEAMKIIHRELPDVKLLILGEGEAEQSLRELATEAGVQDAVIFGGFVKNPYHILSKCDLFVLPSLYEGFPNALAEAMCCGLPVISTDCDSGAREILAPGTDISKKVIHDFERAEYGILCPVFATASGAEKENWAEEKTMADAALLMLQDEDAYIHYKAMGQKRAEQLAMENMIGHWITLIGQ